MFLPKKYMFLIWILKLFFQNCNCTDQQNHDDDQSDQNFKKLEMSIGERFVAEISEDSTNPIVSDFNLSNICRDFNLSNDSKIQEDLLPDSFDNNKQTHMITSDDESRHMITSDDESRHMITSADESRHMITSADESRHMITSADESRHIITSADESRHMITSADESRHMIPSDDESRHMIPSDDESRHMIPSADESRHMIPSADESSFAETRQHNFSSSYCLTGYEDDVSSEVQDKQKMCSSDYSIASFTTIPENFLDYTEMTESHPPSAQMIDKQNSTVSLKKKRKCLSSESAIQKHKLNDSEPFSGHLQPYKMNSLVSSYDQFSYKKLRLSTSNISDHIENRMKVKQLNENFSGLQEESRLTGGKFQDHIKIFCEIMEYKMFETKYAYRFDLKFEEILNTNRLSDEKTQTKIQLTDIDILQPQKDHIIVIGHCFGLTLRKKIECAFLVPEMVGSNKQFTNLVENTDIRNSDINGANSGTVYRMVFLTFHLINSEKYTIPHGSSSETGTTKIITRCSFSLDFPGVECPLKENVLVFHHGQILHLKLFKIIKQQAKFTIHMIDETNISFFSE
ncbi:putative PPE family protein PPE40 [Pseudoloma neurophilia]|uniref:Putative PPE family protein PPE40 n=1 Tax=Pseudoloma neurophilia TaxID=146866 RepID=A0A0R0M3Z9_9MICR|nr:putative PPE family protein PPE40 [Pseudoloma neurophilia]